MCDVDPQRTCSYFWGLFPPCHFWRKSIENCDRESADRQTRAQSQTEFIACSMSICYSHGADNYNAKRDTPVAKWGIGSAATGLSARIDPHDRRSGTQSISFTPKPAARTLETYIFSPIWRTRAVVSLQTMDRHVHATRRVAATRSTVVLTNLG